MGRTLIQSGGNSQWQVTESLDWFELRRANNRRAVVEYSHLGAMMESRWINPWERSGQAARPERW